MVIRHCPEGAVNAPYAVIRGTSPNYIYDVSAGAYVVFQTADWLNYVIQLADEGGGCWAVESPANAGEAGTWVVHNTDAAQPVVTDAVLATGSLGAEVEAEECCCNCLPPSYSILDRYRSCFPSRCCSG